MAIFLRTWNWLGHISLTQWLLSLGGGTVMGVLTFIASQPLWLVLFVALGVVAIILVILTRASRLGAPRAGDWSALLTILERVDSRIPGQLRAGHTLIDTRISEADYVDLIRFKQTPMGGKLIRDVAIKGEMRNSLIANGTLGPAVSLPLQYRVELSLMVTPKDD